MKDRSVAVVSTILGVLSCWLLSSAVPILAAPKTQASKMPGLEGIWQGVLAGKLHLNAMFTKGTGGDYVGSLITIDQGGGRIPIETASLDRKFNKVRFEVKSIGGLYSATANKALTELKGTWRQAATGTTEQELVFTRLSSSEPVSKSLPKATKPITAPLDITIPIAPMAFNSHGKTHLVYELHVNNYQKAVCTVKQLEVIANDKRSIAKFSGSTLEGLAIAPGRPELVQRTKIGPGNFIVIYVWVSLDSSQTAPLSSIRHRVKLQIENHSEEMQIETQAVSVPDNKVDQIDLPLKKGDWLAGNGPSNSSAHRRALIPVNGHAYIGQRFAIDWVRLYSDGKTVHGDVKSNKNYSAYGAEVCSSTNGIVSEVKDLIPENTPGVDSRAVPMTLETLGGNHVGIDLGNGHFAFYCHLQPGSIRVKPGDTVSKGQVLGLLGNSGNSTEPHLHFQLCDGNSILESEGIPYSCTYELMGKDSSSTAQGVELTGIPMEGDVIRVRSTTANSK